MGLGGTGFGRRCLSQSAATMRSRRPPGSRGLALHSTAPPSLLSEAGFDVGMACQAAKRPFRPGVYRRNSTRSSSTYLPQRARVTSRHHAPSQAPTKPACDGWAAESGRLRATLRGAKRRQIRRLKNFTCLGVPARPTLRRTQLRHSA